ncbi:UNVERIFIED_CONTAM: hypothetical protein GTU68_034086, partial [Idotea baltica]|nr:hypothetical protein [Idotea baltica]
VLLAVVGTCVALPQGFLADTPEVIAERQRFIQLYNAAAAAAAAAPDDHVISHQAFRAPQQNTFHSHSRALPAEPAQAKWMGPLASDVPAGLPGSVSQVRNTAEVEAAIAEFTQAYNAAVVANTPSVASFAPRAFAPAPAPVRSHHTFSNSPKRWTGPFASTVPAGLPGSMVVGDTADIASAKAEFNRAFQQQLHAVLG